MAKDHRTLEGETTRQRILEAAKEQFIAVGFERASVRRITDRARANSALLGYHFGSKENLFTEVIRSIAAGIVAKRAASLRSLREEFDDVIPLDRLVRAYAEPFMTRDHEQEQEVAVYLRFFGRLFTEPSDQLIELINAQMIDQQRDYFEEIFKAASHIDEKTLIFRFQSLMGSLAFLGTIARMATPPIGMDDGAIGLADPLAQLSHDYAAIFAMPVQLTQAAGFDAKGERRGHRRVSRPTG
jgi:AcrR family transcriptional regulator